MIHGSNSYLEAIACNSREHTYKLLTVIYDEDLLITNHISLSNDCMGTKLDVFLNLAR